MRVVATAFGLFALTIIANLRSSLAELVLVEIGPSPDKPWKCFKHSLPLQCKEDAGDKANRVKNHHSHHDDTFKITVKEDGQTVCAERTDDPTKGWGMDLYIECEQAAMAPGDTVITIGPSPSALSCIEYSHVMLCDDDAGHAGKRVNAHSNEDTFEITVEGKKICAKRTDQPDKGWDMNLQIKCKIDVESEEKVIVEPEKTNDEEREGEKEEKDKGQKDDDNEPVMLSRDVVVVIGSSPIAKKCLQHSEPLQCEADAGNKDKRLKAREHADMFEITVDGNNICAQRKDEDAGWSWDLQIACKGAVLATDDIVVEIGPSDLVEKCLEQPTHLVCEDDAGHLGKRFNAHADGDTFSISVHEKTVCAKRTDKPEGWTMDLQIKCQKPKASFPWLLVAAVGMVVLVLCFFLVDFLKNNEYLKNLTHARSVRKSPELGNMELPQRFSA